DHIQTKMFPYLGHGTLSHGHSPSSIQHLWCRFLDGSLYLLVKIQYRIYAEIHPFVVQGLIVADVIKRQCRRISTSLLSGKFFSGIGTDIAIEAIRLQGFPFWKVALGKLDTCYIIITQDRL